MSFTDAVAVKRQFVAPGHWWSEGLSNYSETALIHLSLFFILMNVETYMWIIFNIHELKKNKFKKNIRPDHYRPLFNMQGNGVNLV